MKSTKKPAARLTCESITRSFQTSNKKHFILTGNRCSGKSTLAKQLLKMLSPIEIPAITTHAVMKSHVELHDHMTGQTAIIGKFLHSPSLIGNQMIPCLEVFQTIAVNAVRRAILSDSEWVFLDELGYLESCCTEFQEAIRELFQKKRVLAVLRKQSTSFLDSLFRRPDIFLYDLDAPVLPIGCVIMASGLGQRFGSNKLMTSFNGKPLISHILDITGNHLFTGRVVVTRHDDIAALCQERNIPVILHDFPERSHTVRLGLSELQTQTTLAGCLFTVSDQPLLTRESLEMLVLTFSHLQKCKNALNSSEVIPSRASHSKESGTLPDILRLSKNTINGNPVLFEKKYFEELLHLPNGKGGGVLLKKYPERILGVQARFAEELWDIDTPGDLERCEMFLCH